MASTVLKQKVTGQAKHQATAKRIRYKGMVLPDTLALLDKRFGSPESEAYMVEELERVLIGNQIYDLRTKAKMTHGALAKKVGLKAADIDRLENADYEKHPMPTLRKIAAVFGMRIELNFVPDTKKKKKS